MVKSAVILAAGEGKRISGINKPKGFITLGDIPIIEESIQKLLNAGIENIIIGVGYKAENFLPLTDKYPELKLINNPDYSSTGSMATLFCARDAVEEDFVLLESDIIYEKCGLSEIINCPERNVIIASDRTYSRDEVFIETDTAGYLKNMTKQEKLLNKIDGELIGICKMSKDTYANLCAYYNKFLHRKQTEIHYEDAIVAITDKNPFFIYKLSDYVWGEIDDHQHLIRAKEEIYPKLKEKNG